MADGTMVPVPFVGTLQLMWRFSAYHLPSSAVGPDDIADIGYVKEGEHFRLTPYVAPNNFPGTLKGGDRLMVQLRAYADNGESPPFCLEISWDRNWILDTELMQKSLVVKPVECAFHN